MTLKRSGAFGNAGGYGVRARASPPDDRAGLRAAPADERLYRLDDRRPRGARGGEGPPPLTSVLIAGMTADGEVPAALRPALTPQYSATQITGTRIQPRISSNSRRRRRRCQRFSRHDSLRAGAGGAASAGVAGSGAG